MTLLLISLDLRFLPSVTVVSFLIQWIIIIISMDVCTSVSTVQCNTEYKPFFEGMWGGNFILKFNTPPALRCIYFTHVDVKHIDW